MMDVDSGQGNLDCPRAASTFASSRHLPVKPFSLAGRINTPCAIKSHQPLCFFVVQSIVVSSSSYSPSVCTSQHIKDSAQLSSTISVSEVKSVPQSFTKAHSLNLRSRKDDTFFTQYLWLSKALCRSWKSKMAFFIWLKGFTVVDCM